MAIRQNTGHRMAAMSPVTWVMYGLGGVFLIGSLIFGGLLHFYDRFWWWDDMLHCLSGVALVLAGLVIARAVLGDRQPKLWFVVVFAFCLALAIGVLWEIVEFSSDTFFHTALQQWDMPPQAIVMGRSYQGMGLRDTMSDLINATIGATVTVMAIVAYVVVRRRSSAGMR